MNIPTLPRRSSGKDTVLQPRPLPSMCCSVSRRRISATGNRRSRFQSMAFQAKSRCASKINMTTSLMAMRGDAFQYLDFMREIKIGNSAETVIERSDYPLDKVRSILANETVAVLGYGTQGRGQSLNMRDNGLNVI